MAHRSPHKIHGGALPFIIGLLLGFAAREVLAAFSVYAENLNEVLAGAPWSALIPPLLHDPKILAVSLLCLALTCLLAALSVSEWRNRRRRGSDIGEEE